MIRKLILALTVVLVAALPFVTAVPAQARDEHRGHGGHERFEHRELHHFHGYAPYGFYGYTQSCWWQGGYWGYQPYVDAYGSYQYVPQWIPGQYVCN
jgi:hypothetical protein